jgi:hypothetical protein
VLDDDDDDDDNNNSKNNEFGFCLHKEEQQSFMMNIDIQYLHVYIHTYTHTYIMLTYIHT